MGWIFRKIAIWKARTLPIQHELLMWLKRQPEKSYIVDMWKLIQLCDKSINIAGCSKWCNSDVVNSSYNNASAVAKKLSSQTF